VKLVHLVGFVIKKFVTMHSHTDVKKKYKFKFSRVRLSRMCYHHGYLKLQLLIIESKQMQLCSEERPLRDISLLVALWRLGNVTIK
jgi:hypothetical protein